jgi:transposase
LQDKLKPALGHKQLELLEHDAIVCQDKETPHCHCDVQNVVQQWGSEMLAQPPYSPDLTLCDYWLLHM